jgi:hypothetical protein
MKVRANSNSKAEGFTTTYLTHKWKNSLFMQMKIQNYSKELSVTLSERFI